VVTDYLTYFYRSTIFTVNKKLLFVVVQKTISIDNVRWRVCYLCKHLSNECFFTNLFELVYISLIDPFVYKIS